MMLKTCSSILALALTAAAFAAPAADDAKTTPEKTMKSRRKIVVSSLGPAPLQVKPADNQQALALMIDHWKKQLATVLPDKPDLIVLPEACDRFPAMTMEERKDYYTFRGDQIRDFFRQVAKENKCYIAYSAARKMPDGTYRNSTQLIGRDGEIAGIYDKNYPTVGEHLKSGIIPGKDATTVKAKYGPGVTISAPGYVGAVLLSSNLDDVTSADMVKEFKIELWDEYYKRSVDHRNNNVEK